MSSRTINDQKTYLIYVWHTELFQLPLHLFIKVINNNLRFQCYRNEGPTPFRPSMPSLVKYKSVVRKDFFGDLGGVVGVLVYCKHRKFY